MRNAYRSRELYNEQAFRHLLSSESKRSERSGSSFTILLIYSTDKQGLTVQMDCDVADTVAKALFRSLRRTDYIGWYREGRIIGGVLTLLARDSVVEVSVRLQQHVMDILRAEVCVEENCHLHIRVCQQHELEGIRNL
ncbi:MAG: hypothetical protein ABIU05_24585 [Nitrospirales bacterium]